jgi:hypothetical protein
LPDPVPVLRDEAGYVLSDDQKGLGLFPFSDPDGHWWIPSGRVFYSADELDPPALELAQARGHFFLPRRFRDPFGHSATIRYDAHDLLVLETEDALHNKVTVGERGADGTITNRNDYRVLQPSLVTDANGNRAQVAFDVLGMVAGAAVMGKATETLGDLLDASFEPDPTQAQRDAFLAKPREASANANESVATAIVHELLGKATTRILYDLDRFQRLGEPPFAAAIGRETHVSELQQDQQTRIQISFSYSDGFGREIQKKIQAEPGPIGEGGPSVNPRWVGSGWTIFNNKGNPVRQYEPFFDDTHAFKFGNQVGVSPILFYDPVGRVVATLHPNHTWEKAVFDPWRQASWDVNDTVLIADPKADPDVGPFFQRLPESAYVPTWHASRIDGVEPAEQAAAQKAGAHAQTPALAFFDTLGRPFLTVGHNRFDRNGALVEEHYLTRVEMDIEGNQRAMRDALDRVVMRYDYDLLGSCIHQASMEAGQRWILSDVAGQPLYAWDSREHQFRTTFDALRRPTGTLLRTGTGPGPERLIGSTVYGESRPNPEARNQRGKVVQHFDQAGVVTTEEYDFKGNLLASQRQLTRGYKATINWLADPEREQEIFTSSTTYDALNRPTSVTGPDNSVYRPTFNEANLLEKVDIHLRGAQAATPFVTNLDYNAKGQRVLIEYGNNTRTAYK